MEYSISIFLDERRKKAKGRYPLKLRVYANEMQKAKLYPIKMDMTLREFQSVWETNKPRVEFKQKRVELESVQSRANDVAKEIQPFNFEQFEKKLYRKTGEGKNVFHQYERIIEKLKKLNRYGNASNYSLSLKSLKDFITYTKKREATKINFNEITPEWLEAYENYMIGEKMRSRTTVSMYVRALRTVFNVAISEKEIDAEIYPFGKRKYQVPSVKNVKKALSAIQLKTLFASEPTIPEQIKAKDFWFFSYGCNGMNIKDIAMLRWEDLKEDKFVFYRKKTINTSKADLKPVTVYLNDFSRSVIEKYGVPPNEKNDLIFPFIANGATELENFNKIKNFTKFINQNLKKLAKKIELPGEISTYWARHSYATNAVRKGASLEFISEALNHNNMKTTQGYFAGFEEKHKKEMANSLFDF